MARFSAGWTIAALLLWLAASASAQSAPTPASDSGSPSKTVDATAEADDDSEPAVSIERDLGLSAEHFSHSTVIDNEWLSLVPGTQSVTEGESMEDDQLVPHRIEFTVTDLHKTIEGIEAVVVWSVDYANEGDIIEKEISFYAQDDAGQVWYLGEYREEYDGDSVDPRAWVAGQAGALAGIAMPAEPQMATEFYSQGWGPVIGWSDMARIVSVEGEAITTPTGLYEEVLVMDETSDEELAEGAFQQKYYAKHVGLVRVGFSGEDATQETLELTEINHLDEEAMAEVRAHALALEAKAYQSVPEQYGETVAIQ